MTASKFQILLPPFFLFHLLPCPPPFLFLLGSTPPIFSPLGPWNQIASAPTDPSFSSFYSDFTDSLSLSPVWLLYDLLLLSPFSPCMHVCVLCTTHRGAAYAAHVWEREMRKNPASFLELKRKGRKEGFFLIYMALILLDENIIFPAIENKFFPSCGQEVFVLV